MMKKQDVLATLMKLPPRCAVGPTEAKTLGIATAFVIWRGMAGYEPRPDLTDEEAARYNALFSAKPNQIEAMIAGSMFGWEVPGADPDSYAKEAA